jgi:murein DD-endopeptidase MepM/ murein hydrolase activator NlpD
MKIYRACSYDKISQRFGENLNPIYKQVGMIGHNGTDFVLRRGDPVYWDCDLSGKIIYNETDSKGGLGVNVITEENGECFKHRFWHFQKFACHPGQIVKLGDLLGWGDNTGWSTSDHLHRDIKPVYKDVNGNYLNKFPNNGYQGCIDIAPYFENLFCLDIAKVGVLKSMIDVIRKLINLYQQKNSKNYV